VAPNGTGPLNARIQLQRFGVPVYEVFVYQSSFEFRNVEEGRYTLVADNAGYERVLQDVDVPGDDVMIQFRPRRDLVRRAEADAVLDLKIPEPARRQFETARRKAGENKCGDALGHLKKAIQAYAAYGDAHQAMGECYVRMNQLEAAEQEFKRALEQPHRPELHLLLANVYNRGGRQAWFERQVELYTQEKANPSGGR
jgi:tetratricopeptide (TPR) repeat protein